MLSVIADSAGKIRYIDLMEQEIQILKRRGPGLPDYGKGEG